MEAKVRPALLSLLLIAIVVPLMVATPASAAIDCANVPNPGNPPGNVTGRVPEQVFRSNAGVSVSFACFTFIESVVHPSVAVGHEDASAGYQDCVLYTCSLEVDVDAYQTVDPSARIDPAPGTACTSAAQGNICYVAVYGQGETIGWTDPVHIQCTPGTDTFSAVMPAHCVRNGVSVASFGTYVTPQIIRYPVPYGACEDKPVHQIATVTAIVGGHQLSVDAAVVVHVCHYSDLND